MATIKDIAKAAGVAQGTVSNVLNGKGNVSSEKMKHVLAVAETLGYAPNERAKHLRKGNSNVIAVLLPNLRSKQYIDFYLSFKTCAENRNYTVQQYITNDNPEEEKHILNEVTSSMAAGIATISCCSGNIYHAIGTAPARKVIFVERNLSTEQNFIGFDYRKAGQLMGDKALNEKYTQISLITGDFKFSNEDDFYKGFMQTMEKNACMITHIQTDHFRKNQHILQMIDSVSPDAIFISNYGFAENVKDIYRNFYGSNIPPIYSISPLFTMPENDFNKYELNYRLLGNAAAEALVKNIEREAPDQFTYLKSDGFRNWSVGIIPAASTEPLHVLTLDSPDAYTSRNLAKIYSRKTGIDIHFTIYSYEEIYEALMNIGNSSAFDIIRLDVNWLSWFAEKILLPIETIDPDINSSFSDFLNGVSTRYSTVNDKIYTFPFSPSMQLLYYRKDLFDDTILKRIFRETHKKELLLPETFDDFNELACFFTKSFTSTSPVDYGTTMTLGNTSVASSEFFSRFFSYNENLYDKDFKVRLNGEASYQAMTQLIECKQFSNPNYNIWWTDTAASFASGNVAMSLLYSNFASDLLRHSSKIPGNIGYTLAPGRNPVVGGGCLGISKYSKHPEKALSFIKWICSEPISSAAALLGSISPCQATYNNYEIVDTFPWMNLVKDCFSISKGYRTPPDSAFPFNDKKLCSIIGIAVKNAYGGAMTIKESLDHAQDMYESQFQV